MVRLKVKQFFENFYQREKEVNPPTTLDLFRTHQASVSNRGLEVNDPHLTELWRREEAFITTAKDLLFPIEVKTTNKLYKRLLHSELLVLYQLIVFGDIDQMFERHLRLLRTSSYYKQEISKVNPHLAKEPDDLQQAIAVKAILAEIFIEKITQKNREKKDWNGRTGITFGLEVEYTPLPLPQEYHDFVELGVFFSRVFNSNFVNRKMDQDLYEEMLHFIEDNSDDEIHKRQLLVFFQLSKDTGIDAFLSHADFKFLQLNSRVTHRMNEVPYLPYKEVDECGKDRELISEPGFSVRQQIREVIRLYQMGLLTNELNLHTTYGGIKLNQNHVEIMEVLPISAAAGLLPSNVINFPESSFNDEFAEWELLEKIPKFDMISSINTKHIYFPFHRSRRFSETSLGSSNKHGVERRGLFNYPISEISNFIRESLFAEAAAWAIRSVQKDQKNRDSKDEKLVDLWERLMFDWHNLCLSYDINIPDKEDYFVLNPTYRGIEEAKLPYRMFVTDVAIESGRPDFRKTASSLILNFVSRVNQIIE